MPITAEERTYLKNKHKGGKNNSKGANYENFYATYKIALLIDRYIKQLDNVRLTSQLENCFVDDLLIVEPDAHRTYHQLKDVKDLTWNTKKLRYDFKRQKDISSEVDENFELKLVHSNSTTMVTPIPDEIISCTTTLFFPAEKSLNQLILSYFPLKEAIQSITVSKQAEDDELSGIAGAILGAWSGMEQKDVSLKQISDAVRYIGKGYTNIKTYPDASISDDCIEIFRRCNLDFYISGINLYWSTKNNKLKGEIEWTPEIEQKVRKAAPSDFWKLIELLN